MLNVCIFSGRMVADPELHKTASGSSVTSFSLAVQRNRKSADGERKTDFVDLVAWRGTADYVCKNLKKGDLVSVTCRYQPRSYTTKDDQKRTAAEFVVQEINKVYNRTNNAAPAATEEPPAEDFYPEIQDDDELPFDQEGLPL